MMCQIKRVAFDRVFRNTFVIHLNNKLVYISFFHWIMHTVNTLEILV